MQVSERGPEAEPQQEYPEADAFCVFRSWILSVVLQFRNLISFVVILQLHFVTYAHSYSRVTRLTYWMSTHCDNWIYQWKHTMWTFIKISCNAVQGQSPGTGSGMGDEIPRSWRLLHFRGWILSVVLHEFKNSNSFVVWNEPATEPRINNMAAVRGYRWSVLGISPAVIWALQ